MKALRSEEKISVEHSSGNVYADLGLKDADEMFHKASLVAKVSDIIQERGWPWQQAAQVLGMTHPKLSLMLRGQFHDISMTQILSCLTRLGYDVQIVVRPQPGPYNRPGSIQMVFL